MSISLGGAKKPTDPPLGMVIAIAPSRKGERVLTDTVTKVIRQGATLRMWRVLFENGEADDLAWGEPSELGTPVGLTDSAGRRVVRVIERGKLFTQWQVFTRRGLTVWVSLAIPGS